MKRVHIFRPVKSLLKSSVALFKPPSKNDLDKDAPQEAAAEDEQRAPVKVCTPVLSVSVCYVCGVCVCVCVCVHELCVYVHELCVYVHELCV